MSTTRPAMSRRLGRAALAAALGAALLSPLTSTHAVAAVADAPNPPQRELKLWYDEAAPQRQTPQSAGKADWTWQDLEKGWEDWSLPLGNGYVGASVFGGAATERIQLTENSFRNPYSPSNIGKYNSGVNNFAETYIDFGHTSPTNYKRDLTLNDATAGVEYVQDGTTYKREYFASHPDKVVAMRFTASANGKLNFTLKPQTPYLKSYNKVAGDGMGKTGTVTAAGDTITLKGALTHYGIKYEGQYKVIPTGGTTSTQTKDGRGEIVVKDADSATVLFAAGTNYQLESRVFTAADKDKLTPYADPHDKVTSIIDAAAAKSYTELKSDHEDDYTELFDRVRVDLGGAVPTKTTDVLRSGYGSASATEKAYLEELMFQYGRYLLVASSRAGGLPNNLQGIWNAYDSSPWGAGMWHNINQQMNMWPSFTTNLAETFEPYTEYSEAALPAARKVADNYIAEVNPSAKAADGQNGWSVGTGLSPYMVGAPDADGHSGPGTGAFTSLMFEDYAQYTGDATYARDVTYPRLLEMARFLDKTLKNYNGTYLVEKSASPEQREGSTHYRTTGTAFDQQMVTNNLTALLAQAKKLGIDNAELDKYRGVVDKLDPVVIGRSGQVKEYREENFYGEIGDPQHRHISQLVGLHPGTLITPTTDAWLDAARITLNKRGDGGTGWAKAHKINLWARAHEGNRAHTLLRGLISGSTLPNLWGTHPPFQIDANFGLTSGVSEMLLQSNDGALEPLASLSSAWGKGSYKGLTARGGFTVDAAWTGGRATSFAVGSTKGGEAKVKYTDLATGGVQVQRKSDGASVSFTTSGRDTIAFPTTKGETYVISDIPADATPSAPTNVKATRTSAAGFDVTWSAVSGAARYEVYAAYGNDASYEKVGSTTSPKFGFVADGDADQVTVKVRAVASNGALSTNGPTTLLRVEPVKNVAQGKPVTANQSPYDSRFPATHLVDGKTDTRFAYKDNVTGNLVMTVDLQGKFDLTSVRLNEFGDATRVASYKIEADNGSGFSEAAAGSVSSKTDLTRIGVNTRNTEKLRLTLVPKRPGVSSPSVWELEAFGLPGGQVMLGATATANQAPYSASFPVSNLVDGDGATRFAYKDSSTGNLVVNAKLSAAADLKKVTLNEFVDNATSMVSRVGSYTVEANDGTAWKQIATGSGLGTGTTTSLTKSIDVDAPRTQELRFTFVPKSSTRSPSFWELGASG